MKAKLLMFASRTKKSHFSVRIENLFRDRRCSITMTKDKTLKGKTLRLKYGILTLKLLAFKNLQQDHETARRKLYQCSKNKV